MTGPIKGIIVDDELSGRENLKTLIEGYCTGIEITGTASSAIEAKKLVEDLSPDVVFLDISMPVLDGFDFIDSVDSSKFMIVFVTAHAEYAIRAIKAKAVDYLLKPINIHELQQAVKRLQKNFTTLPKFDSNHTNQRDLSDKLILPVAHGFKVVNPNDIIRFDAENCYTHVIFSGGKKITVSKTLKDFEEKMNANVFFRVHKSYLINLNHIKDYSKIDGGIITMSDGIKIQVSRRRAAEFEVKFKQFISKR